jgi:hypothetical protein
MGFSDTHSITSPTETSSAICNLWPDLRLRAGTYDGGLLSVVDSAAAKGLLCSWVGLEAFLPLVTTAFGDVYAVDTRSGWIYWLDTQYGLMDFVDKEIAWVLDVFIDIPEIGTEVLQQEKFARLRARNRELRYHEVFILNPWLMFGGVDDDPNHMIGDCAVYLDLVGHARGNVRAEIEGFE